MLVRPLFLAILESALSRFLALDPDAGQFLEPLGGKVIAIKFTNPHLIFFLCPSSSGIQMLEHFEGSPDACLTGSPIDFARMGFSHRPTDALFSGDVHIEGDMTTARKFQDLIENLDVDWEEQISRITGDAISHPLGNLLRSARAWTGQTIETLQLNTSEYLQEEIRELPARAEVNLFFRAGDKIRADIDRLEARVQRLLSISEPPDES